MVLWCNDCRARYSDCTWKEPEPLPCPSCRGSNVVPFDSATGKPRETNNFMDWYCDS